MSTKTLQIWILATILASLLSLGCAAALVQPTVADVHWSESRWPGTTLEELQKGRALYVQTCAGCHTLHRPEAYPPEEWPDILKEMEEEMDEDKSTSITLDPADRRLIERFLVASSTRLRAAPLNVAGPAGAQH